MYVYVCVCMYVLYTRSHIYTRTIYADVYVLNALICVLNRQKLNEKSKKKRKVAQKNKIERKKHVLYIYQEYLFGGFVWRQVVCLARMYVCDICVCVAPI